MAIQVINRGGGLGSRLGEALGQGLGQGFAGSLNKGLENILEEKMQDMRLGKLAQNLGAYFPGKSPEEIKSFLRFGQLAPKLASTAYQDMTQAPARQAYEDELNRIQGQTGMQSQEGEPSQELIERRQALLKPEDRLKLAEFERKRQKDINESQKALKPFLDAHYKDMQAASVLKKQAQQTLQLLRKVKDKLPGNLATAKWAEYLGRDPELRKLVADYNRLVKLSSAFGKGEGAITNFKLKLEQAAKASLDQPFETQEEILKDLISSADDVYKTDDKITELRKKNKGILPIDATQRLIEAKRAEEQAAEPIMAGAKVASVDTKQIPVGKRAQNPKTKEIYVWDGQEFVPEAEFERAQNARTQ